MLKFNFCVMAEVANLARHLLMTEVLQICESVHKQVEEQKLMVYQRSEPQIVVSAHSAEQEIPEGSMEKAEAYMVTIQDDGGAVVTHQAVAVAGEPLEFVAQTKEEYVQQPVAVLAQAVGGEAVHAVEAEQNQSVALLAHSGQAEARETITLISGCAEGMEGETVTVVTHSGQAGASESLSVVSACLAMEQPLAAEAFVIDTSSGKVSPPEVTLRETIPQHGDTKVPNEEPAPAPPKRKRGRPAKLKKEVEELVLLEEQPFADEDNVDKQEAMSDDPSKRRLRQRSMTEGSYARLHMGLEEEEEGKGGTPPQPSTPKVQNQV